MTTTDLQPPCDDFPRFNFSFPLLDTLVRVEKSNERVLIRASRDTFSEPRKISFVHELAAEGFIDDSYASFSGFDRSFFAIDWVIDGSWLMPDKAARAATNRFMIRLIASVALLWVVLMGGLILLSK